MNNYDDFQSWVSCLTDYVNTKILWTELMHSGLLSYAQKIYIEFRVENDLVEAKVLLIISQSELNIVYF